MSIAAMEFYAAPLVVPRVTGDGAKEWKWFVRDHRGRIEQDCALVVAAAEGFRDGGGMETSAEEPEWLTEIQLYR
jgi:hypothetical protein